MFEEADFSSSTSVTPHFPAGSHAVLAVVIENLRWSGCGDRHHCYIFSLHAPIGNEVTQFLRESHNILRPLRAPWQNCTNQMRSMLINCISGWRCQNHIKPSTPSSIATTSSPHLPAIVEKLVLAGMRLLLSLYQPSGSVKDFPSFSSTLKYCIRDPTALLPHPNPESRRNY
ncbi:hypothetical protein AOLI_G00273530 [Acnodon oligacanthus]